MKMKRAFKIVLELARQNQLDIDTVDEELREEAQKQENAIKNVEDFAYNEEIFK